jgi:hypothetical protein
MAACRLLARFCRDVPPLSCPLWGIAAALRKRRSWPKADLGVRAACRAIGPRSENLSRSTLRRKPAHHDRLTSRFAGGTRTIHPLRVLSLGKEHHMAIYNEEMCDDLRTWITLPAKGPPEYSADPVVQHRVGRILAAFAAKAQTAAGMRKV